MSKLKSTLDHGNGIKLDLFKELFWERKNIYDDPYKFLGSSESCEPGHHNFPCIIYKHRGSCSLT